MTPEQRARYIWKTLCGNGYADDITLSSIADEIKAAVAEAAPRWIPVGERLPDDEVGVWVYPHRARAWRGDGGWWADGYIRLVGVTHWQPLPPPPAD